MITTTDIKKKYSPVTPTTSFDETEISVSIGVDGGEDYNLVLNAVSTEFGATITTTESYKTGEHITIVRTVELTQEVELDTRTLRMPITDPEGLELTYPKVEDRPRNPYL